jgi:hypothetical protein
MADPIANQDAATKAWVLTQVAGGATSSTTAKAATTAAITLSVTQTVDGISLSVNDICLVKNQAGNLTNGLYTVQSGAWTRTLNMDVWTEVPGVLVTVQQGTVNADTLWLSTADQGGSFGTNPITFSQMPGPSDVIAGAGMTRTGQQIDVIAADTSMQVNADSLQVKLDTRAITVAAGGIGVDTNNSLTIASLKLAANPAVIFMKADYIIRETPTGTINGVNAAFTLAGTPVVGAEMLFLNGLLLESGAGNDYTIAGTNITMLTTSIPVTGDRLRCSYMKGPSPLGAN